MRRRGWGLTSRNKLWVALYTERYPLPRVVGFKPTATFEGGVQIHEAGPAQFVETRTGLVRNVEVGVYMDIDTVKRLYEWLGKRLEEMTAEKPE
jgi:hypothetical protein